MITIHRGSGQASFDLRNDGLLHASLGGLVSPRNAGELSALLLMAAFGEGAGGVLCSVQRGLVALPPIGPPHYDYVPRELRSIPVAVLITAEQTPIYERITGAAALSGTMRRAFRSREQAEAWLREQARALTANRRWWSERRSPQ